MPRIPTPGVAGASASGEDRIIAADRSRFGAAYASGPAEVNEQIATSERVPRFSTLLQLLRRCTARTAGHRLAPNPIEAEGGRWVGARASRLRSRGSPRGRT